MAGGKVFTRRRDGRVEVRINDYGRSVVRSAFANVLAVLKRHGINVEDMANTPFAGHQAAVAKLSLASHPSELCLQEIGLARQQKEIAIGAEIEALEKAEAERVIAGQPEQAFLGEQQHAVEALVRHRRLETLFARRHFVG